MSSSELTCLLADVASQLAAPGRGLLASDESTGTIGKRLEKAGVQNTEVSGALASCSMPARPTSNMPLAISSAEKLLIVNPVHFQDIVPTFSKASGSPFFVLLS